MKTVVLCCVLVCCLSAFAAPPTVREQQLITDAMNMNFDACNREDINAVMKSCADAMPDRDKFRRETLASFEEKDIHYSLVQCEVLDVRPPWAKARIVQDTHVLDRKSKDEDQAAFRNSSALLMMRARLVCTALMLATLCATVQSEDTSHITTLSPEGAEKLICHDTQTRYVELVRRIRVPTCRQEERRREVNGETLTHWVTVHVVEEKHVPVRICCKGDLLALKELRELSVPAAAVLGNHNGILDLGGLEDLPPDVARALTQGNVRSLYLDGLETISHKTAEALLPFAGDVSLWSLKKVDLPTFETLRLRHSLPYAVTVEGSDNHVVNWGKREQRTIADCVVRLSVECGKPVTIAEDVLSKHNHGFADRLAAPPYTVMYRSEAIDWLASEISKDSPGTVVARDEGEGVRFVEKEKASP